VCLDGERPPGVGVLPRQRETTGMWGVCLDGERPPECGGSASTKRDHWDVGGLPRRRKLEMWDAKTIWSRTKDEADEGVASPDIPKPKASPVIRKGQCTSPHRHRHRRNVLEAESSSSFRCRGKNGEQKVSRG
jgi:hypothetical protein